MALRVSNLGYIAIRKETTKGTPAGVPNVYLPAYSESLMTAVNLSEDTSIIGNKAARRQLLQGLRNHGGDIQVLAEPNTVGYLFDMLLYLNQTSGSDPYTHQFKAGTTEPSSYTVDISKGSMVFRFMGVEASSIAGEFDDNKLMLNLSVAALKSFLTREIASVSTNEVTFSTNYDTNPTAGLVVGDTIQILDVSAGTTQDFTVSSIDSATVVTLSGSPTSIGSGDLMFIKPQANPSFNNLQPFLWGRSEFRFAADASTALSTTHTPLDEASWEVKHDFTNDEGEQRSGSFDPAELGRGLVDATLSATKYFDNQESLNRYLTAAKRGLVMRHFSSGSYELRITLNNVKANEHPANLSTGDPILAELEYMSQYDDSDGNFITVEVLNAISGL